MKQTHAAILAGLSAATTHSQTVLMLDIAPTGNGSEWALTAELVNPTGTVRAAVSDLGFRMTGFEITNFTYNPAFDSDFFGSASVNINGDIVEFTGTNALPPLNNAGGPDSSNPLLIATFEFSTFDFQAFEFELLGQVTGAYAGVPFDQVLFYQNADGSPGDIPWGFFLIPAPGSASVVALAGAVLVRRRR